MRKAPARGPGCWTLGTEDPRSEGGPWLPAAGPSSSRPRSVAGLPASLVWRLRKKLSLSTVGNFANFSFSWKVQVLHPKTDLGAVYPQAPLWNP